MGEAYLREGGVLVGGGFGKLLEEARTSFVAESCAAQRPSTLEEE